MAKVTMFHAQSGVTQQASQAAYDRVYASEGWQLVETSAPTPAVPVTDPDAVPVGTIDEVLAWVRGHADDTVAAAEGWEDRGARALEAEHSKGDKARKRLVEALEQGLTKPED